MRTADRNETKAETDEVLVLRTSRAAIDALTSLPDAADIRASVGGALVVGIVLLAVADELGIDGEDERKADMVAAHPSVRRAVLDLARASGRVFAAARSAATPSGGEDPHRDAPRAEGESR